jgi:hypothetical protein
MGPIFADPRQRNEVVALNIKESLTNLRKAIVADVYEQFQAEMADWVAKEEKWQAEVEALRAALESAQREQVGDRRIASTSIPDAGNSIQARPSRSFIWRPAAPMLFSATFPR